MLRSATLALSIILVPTLLSSAAAAKNRRRSGSLGSGADCRGFHFSDQLERVATQLKRGYDASLPSDERVKARHLVVTFWNKTGGRLGGGKFTAADEHPRVLRTVAQSASALAAGRGNSEIGVAAEVWADAVAAHGTAIWTWKDHGEDPWTAAGRNAFLMVIYSQGTLVASLMNARAESWFETWNVTWWLILGNPNAFIREGVMADYDELAPGFATFMGRSTFRRRLRTEFHWTLFRFVFAGVFRDRAWAAKRLLGKLLFPGNDASTKKQRFNEFYAYLDDKAPDEQATIDAGRAHSVMENNFKAVVHRFES